MYCTKCGNPVNKGDNFCIMCGKAIKKDTPELKFIRELNRVYNCDNINFSNAYLYAGGRGWKIAKRNVNEFVDLSDEEIIEKFCGFNRRRYNLIL